MSKRVHERKELLFTMYNYCDLFISPVAKQANIVLQTFEIMLVKHNVCRPDHHTNMFLTNISFGCDSFEKFQNIGKQ